MTLTTVEMIAAKRDGGDLSAPDIARLISAYTRGEVPGEQMSALLMAILWRGMTPAETSAWTQAMVDSGTTLDWTGLGAPTVDKHSTGGVGDKVTLPLGPIVAACGAAVPQLSGRGLGHTGGTLDKLEAIPGWQADLSLDQMRQGLREVGALVCAATPDLAPADRLLYALRDATATVESIPMIAASIMSKKIAEGTSALVLDVKTGSGAFMAEPERARELARAMVAIGSDHGMRVRALVTAMDVPLGRSAGNALEVAEALETLAGGGPSDLRELTLLTARHMLDLAGLPDADPQDALDSGRAMDKWRQMISFQGGDPGAPLPRARHTHQILAPATGVLARLDARAVGAAAWRLGAGRSKQGEHVQAGAGVEWSATVGDRVSAGQPLLTLHTDTPERMAGALDALEGAWEISTDRTPISRLPLLVDQIG